jgi:cellulose synthase/poly-beta-1,6-N-acetylglucosamine synthase-like glycosyltransferase
MKIRLITFVISSCLIVYPIVIYPVLIAALGAIRNRRVNRASNNETVSVLICAYNEERFIAATVENILDQDFPRDRMEILVISDASADKTDEIVRGFGDRGVVLLRNQERLGKAAGLNLAVSRARGEILVFCDANSRFSKDAITRMVENFSDKDVGYVTGDLRLTSATGGEQGSGIYFRYEGLLRALETRAGSIIGVNGGVDAMRKRLYRDVPRDQISDFVLPLRVLESRMRVVYDSRVVSHEAANESSADEFNMRVRVAMRALRGLAHVPAVLNPFGYPMTFFCLFSHKIIRYFTFLFMFSALAANVLLAMGSETFLAILIIHLAIYATALLPSQSVAGGRLSSVAIALSYFIMSNVAFAIACVRLLRGQSVSTWKPRAG